jgi:hypothetical protein
VTRSADKRALGGDARRRRDDSWRRGRSGARARSHRWTRRRRHHRDDRRRAVAVVGDRHGALGRPLLLFGIITAKEGRCRSTTCISRSSPHQRARAKSEDYPAAIGLVERGQVRLEPLISNVVPLEELKAAIGMLAPKVVGG